MLALPMQLSSACIGVAHDTKQSFAWTHFRSCVPCTLQGDCKVRPQYGMSECTNIVGYCLQQSRHMNGVVAISPQT